MKGGEGVERSETIIKLYYGKEKNLLSIEGREKEKHREKEREGGREREKLKFISCVS